MSLTDGPIPCYTCHLASDDFHPYGAPWCNAPCEVYYEWLHDEPYDYEYDEGEEYDE